MMEYDQLCSILNEEFLYDRQDEMIEEKGSTHKIQHVSIDDGRRTLARSLYRFDLEKNEFLPFFNKADGSPEGLRKFCDYILLVKYEKKTYILLIELKRGNASGADKQLNASEVFIEFLYKTAERLYKDFRDFNFNRKNVVLRKIIIKTTKSNKTEIKRRKINTNGIILYYSTGQFYLGQFLKKYNK